MSVLISKVAVEDSYLSMSDKVVTKLVIYKNDGSAVFLRFLPNEKKEVLASGLRHLADELEK